MHPRGPKPSNGEPKPSNGEPKPLNGEPKPLIGEPKPLIGEPKPLNGEPKPLNGERRREDEHALQRVTKCGSMTWNHTELSNTNFPSLPPSRCRQAPR